MASGKRLFVALWPDDAVRGQLGTIQQQVMNTTGLFSGAVARDNFHMTLQFLASVPSADFDRLDNSLSHVIAHPFSLELDCWGQFARPGILWVGPSKPDVQLFQLQASVLSATRGICRSSNNNYKPHVTLFRKVFHLPEVSAFQSVEWYIERFVLVESMTDPAGVKYRVLREYPLN